MMGVSEEQLELEDPDSLARQWIDGWVTKDLGPIGGEIWRKNKPVFTGIVFKTTQRKTDL